MASNHNRFYGDPLTVAIRTFPDDEAKKVSKIYLYTYLIVFALAAFLGIVMVVVGFCNVSKFSDSWVPSSTNDFTTNSASTALVAVGTQVSSTVNPSDSPSSNATPTPNSLPSAAETKLSDVGIGVPDQLNVQIGTEGITYTGTPYAFIIIFLLFGGAMLLICALRFFSATLK